MEQIKYQYNDGNGRLLYTVVKFPNKEFRRLRQDQNGKEHWNWDGIKQVPYRWPDIKDHRAVIFVEGEKDAENSIDFGFLATTVQGGNWHDDYLKYFKDAEIICVPDLDKLGLKKMKKYLIS